MKMKYGIMLISGDPVLKRDIRRFFSSSPDVSISMETTDLENILRLLTIDQTHETNVMVFDLDYYEIGQMIDFMSKCNHILPGIVKIVYSNGQFIARPELMNQVMKLGNIHFCVKPIETRHLREIMVVTGFEKLKPVSNGRVLTFISSSGGTGKTTFLVNLAWTLARENPELRIALFDFDSGFGSVAINLNIKSGPYKCFESLANEFINYDIVDEDIFRKHFIEVNNIDVLPAQCSLSDIDVSLHNGAEAVIERARDFYDYIFIDTSSYIEDQLLSAAVTKADRVFNVFTPRVYDIRNTKVMTRLLRDLNIPVAKHLFILNRLGLDDAQRIPDIEKLIGARPLIRIRENFETIAISGDQGIPPVVKYPESDLARDIAELSKAIISDDYTQFSNTAKGSSKVIWKKLSSLWG
ncbi:MAG: hypothetical protein CVV64_17345 [Candidatus Wallbacteria bacterium HGW-Wallbacteria-1]|jgi:MinD-like ATPase involved in chromosome partitioning or flagellar assembly|uniref:AAA domain-containing protein n=1 Tax=Candidatus Wallbacteria bacterium HGW-Wallbacteria-1 TaxID=2013854 RepID=A0A2N1PKB3_9BACT|nr:MAG: hypothetical protein CVV64_17345 [Candidatus Wallbacteria bacterium HGW-Wallbacteria-1]